MISQEQEIALNLLKNLRSEIIHICNHISPTTMSTLLDEHEKAVIDHYKASIQLFDNKKENKN